jgi:hypothetical protein
VFKWLIIRVLDFSTLRVRALTGLSEGVKPRNRIQLAISDHYSVTLDIVLSLQEFFDRDFENCLFFVEITGQFIVLLHEYRTHAVRDRLR